MKKVVLDEKFFDELYREELNEDCYNKYDLINELLINNKNIEEENLELFRNGYVSKLIQKRLKDIKSVDEVKFEMNKLELFANNLPLQISKELFTSREVLDSLLILNSKVLNYIFKESDIKLLSIITNSYLKKYNDEKDKTKKIKEEYEKLLEKGLMERRIEQKDLIDMKEQISTYSSKINKQSYKEEKCLAFVICLNSLLMEALSKSSKNITK